MALSSKHPSYTKILPDWNLMADTHAGERRIKDQREMYLPVTSGQKADGMASGQPGKAAYDAYKERAVFPNSVKDAVESMLGVMHHKSPVIELPTIMEPMLESPKGEAPTVTLRATSGTMQIAIPPTADPANTSNLLGRFT